MAMICVTYAAPGEFPVPPGWTGLGAPGYCALYHQSDDMPEFLSSQALPSLEEAKVQAAQKWANGRDVYWDEPSGEERTVVKGIVCVMRFGSRDQ